MKRFMDCLFRGIIRIVSQDADIRLICKDSGLPRNDKNFAIRLLSNNKTGNRIVIQSLNGNTIDKWLFQIDGETGIATQPYMFISNGISLSVKSLPNPIKGGLVYLDDVGWYKCEDGANWVLANI